MSSRIIFGLLLGAACMAQGLWVLAVQPDPPATARVATRKSRQITAIAAVVIGVFAIALNAASLQSE
jgi:hypothetical protein